MQFYKNLKRARVRMGKTQIEVAKAVGISNAALSNYETGYREPDLQTLASLARYYGITLDELVNVDTDDTIKVYDLHPLVKGKYIGFKGAVYALKESQKKVIIKELDRLFQQFEKSKLVKDESSKGINPHINRGGMLGSNLAGSRGAKRQDTNR
ncbi:helix-turn-helix domain-containing protein [Veillonella agrestimuris]|uniref:helix-turn-helix domain-containing protein n=1 Tax=Veillonella agrestimuris TaxID=2941340 RepID=UPI0020419526|nr:helix-turn-helix transcriptional regulator [Veillonella agrestimuris]